jgi:hypothetical protein
MDVEFFVASHISEQTSQQARFGAEAGTDREADALKQFDEHEDRLPLQLCAELRFTAGRARRLGLEGPRTVEQTPRDVSKSSQFLNASPKVITIVVREPADGVERASAIVQNFKEPASCADRCVAAAQTFGAIAEALATAPVDELRAEVEQAVEKRSTTGVGQISDGFIVTDHS